MRQAHHRVVAGGHFVHGEARQAAGAAAHRGDGRVGRFGAVDEVARQPRPALSVEVQRLAVGPVGVRAEGVGHLAAQQPVAVGTAQAEAVRVGGRQGVAVRVGCGGACGNHLRAVLLAPAFAGQGDHRVEVDKAAQRLRVLRGQPICGAGDHHAAITVADQDDVAEFLGLHQSDHVGHVGLQGDAAGGQGMAQVRAFTVAGEGDCVDFVAGRTQRAEHAAPDPGTTPGAMDQDDGSRTGVRHLRPSGSGAQQLAPLTTRCSADWSMMRMSRCLTSRMPSSWNLEKVRLTVSSLRPR